MGARTINLPAEDLSPEQLAHSAIDLISEVGGDAVSYRITKGEDLREQGYAGIHTVGRGLTRPPVLLALDFNPGGDDSTPVYACLVGKGITFDTGGYSSEAERVYGFDEIRHGRRSNGDRCTGTGDCARSE
ncbi:hypothetical protein E05_26840 [Plautia stali symbiont]|nr:hypothetical protein E05_26840 [Plautia stali symbiont]